MSLQTNRISAEKDCDLLVIGGGGAGMVAAARAACQSHRKIIVLEKTKLTGGAALFASTLRTFRSHWQEKRGIPDQMDDFIRKGMDATGWQLDPRLVNNCCLATGRFFDWFCQVGGAGTEEKFKPAPYVFDGPDGQLGPELIGGYCHHGTGYLVMQILLDFCCKNGVEILTLHRAVDVEISHGKITAVLAEGPAGTVRIRCRACIMASGSWVRNETLMRRLEPRFLNVLDELDSSCRPHVRDIYTRDAIALSEKAGAAVDYDNMCLRMMGPCVRSSSQVLNSMGTSPYGISVNLHGARWSCEPIQRRMGLFRAGHVLFRQPKGLTYFIFDRNNLEAAILASHASPQEDGGFFGRPQFPPTQEETLADMERTVSKQSGEAFQAPTLEELALQIGLSPAALVRTVKQYNACCAVGSDDLFHKDPKALVPLSQGPYWAVRGRIGSDGAFGGIKVNPDMQAYRPDGSLADGLYAAGDIASGRFVKVGDFKEQILNDCSWAFASGFIAADAACDYLERLD